MMAVYKQQCLPFDNDSTMLAFQANKIQRMNVLQKCDQIVNTYVTCAQLATVYILSVTS